MISISHIKFGSAVMVGGKQETSVTEGLDRKGETLITYREDLGVYSITRGGREVIVHPTNVQYAVPKEIKAQDYIVPHGTEEDESGSSEPQGPRRGRRPRTTA